MADVSYGLYAAPSFIEANGMPETIEEVNRLNGIVYARSGIPERWVLRNRKKAVHLDPYPKFNVNEYWMAKFFAVEGSAVGYLPDFFVNFWGALLRHQHTSGISVAAAAPTQSANVDTSRSTPSRA